jgi:hypothetical protein
MPRRCDYCKTVVEKGEKICPSCGAPLPFTPDEPRTPERVDHSRPVTRSSVDQPTSQSQTPNVQVTVQPQTVVKQESFVGRAFIALILYYLGLYIVGLILNIVFLSNANGIRNRTGSSPSGRGCLLFLIWTHFWIPLLAFLIIIIISLALGEGAFGIFEEFF